MLNVNAGLPFPEDVPMAILHSLFVKGEEMAYDLKEDDLDVVELYPEYKYTTVDELLDIFLVDPPKPVLGAFWVLLMPDVVLWQKFNKRL